MMSQIGISVSGILLIYFRREGCAPDESGTCEKHEDVTSINKPKLKSNGLPSFTRDQTSAVSRPTSGGCHLRLGVR